MARRFSGLNRVPNDGWHVYGIKALGAPYLYIGSSFRLRDRLRRHADEDWFPFIACVDTIRLSPYRAKGGTVDRREDALLLERTGIAFFGPVHNRTRHRVDRPHDIFWDHALGRERYGYAHFMVVDSMRIDQEAGAA